MPPFGFQQCQTTRLNQHIITSLQILQLSQAAVDSLIDQALLDNPLLTTKPTASSDTTESIRHDNFKAHRESSSYDSEWINNIAVPEKSLADHLHDQLALQEIADDMMQSLEIIIDALNPDGYLTIDLSKLSNDTSVPLNKLEKAQQIVQELDPPGVGATDLMQCLDWQLSAEMLDYHHHPKQPLARQLLNHPDWLSDYPNSQSNYCETYQFDSEAIDAAVHLIRSLNPKPGANYSKIPTNYLRPDILVEIENQNVVATVMKTRQLQIDPSILNQIAKHTETPKLDNRSEPQEWLRQQKQSAERLIQALDYRVDTLSRLADYLTEQQCDYFKYGLSALQPLSITEAADAIGVSPSTISRAAHNKAIQSPQGCEIVRQLFSTALPNQTSLTARYAKHCIHQLISEEPIHLPFSDAQLIQKLSDKGIQLSRRTLTKYRLALNIPNSRERKIRY